jgi:D-arabinitol dehydrogenase (NADP+)
MKAVLINEPGKYSLTTVPRPIPGPEEVLIKVAAAGICGTDIHIFRGEYEATYPIIPGHEFSGTVVQVGSAVKYYSPGDRVTADPNIPCRRCPACQRGYANQCETLEAVGVTREGAFAEYVVVPEEVVFPIGEMPFRAAAMVEPLACVVWGIKRVQVQPGDSAVVFGAGPMGCLVTQILKSAGASQVVVVDMVDWRLDLAKKLGASHTVIGHKADEILLSLNPKGYQIVVDATGVGSVLENAFKYACPRGKIWIFGVVPPKEKVSFLPYEIFRKDLTILGSFAVNQTFHESIALINSGRIQVEPLISHEYPLTRFGEAMDRAQNHPQRMKIQLTT